MSAARQKRIREQASRGFDSLWDDGRGQFVLPANGETQCHETLRPVLTNHAPTDSCLEPRGLGELLIKWYEQRVVVDVPVPELLVECA
jgi:hypothetical protein